MQVTLNALPASLAEFRNLSLNTPDEVVAGFLCALNLYVKNPNEGVEAMNILRGPRPMTPYDYEYDLPLGYSFTVCDEDYGGDMIEESMWTAPTAEQLARYVWTWQGDLAEQPAMATMSLTQGSGAEPGQITFTWWYTKDYGDPQEIYEGSWSLTDSGEHIDLTMTRSGGRQYTKGEAPTTVSGMFPVQVPAAFDVFPVLNVTGGGGAYGFPIQQIPNELLMFEPAQG